uniref:SCP2 domain-containing protein n=1 Tax=Elaeophora elaphi TaxID=1147741 RepID=A0A0R3RGL4_9BILA
MGRLRSSMGEDGRKQVSGDGRNKGVGRDERKEVELIFIMLDLNFTNKVVIVTGAGGSLGKAYALEFAKREAFVVVNDLGTTQDGLYARAVPNFDSVECGHKIVETAITHFGRVDVIINNAGILLDRSFQNMSDDDWGLHCVSFFTFALFDCDIIWTHVKGAYSVTKAAWPFFKKQRYGRIIFISSNSAIYGNFGQANYAAAKNALVGLSHTLAIEGSRYGIQSNVVIPTASSRMTAQLFLEESLQFLKAEYVVPLVVYLGHESCQETGKVFEAGAGWFGQIQTYRSKGIVLPAANAETIADNWISITDMTSAKHFDSIQEVTVDLLKCAEKEGTSEKSWELKDEKKDEYMELFKVFVTLFSRMVAMIVAEALNKKKDNGSTSCFMFMFILTNGVDVCSFTMSYGEDRVPNQRELICVVTMHCDVFEEILKGQIITKKIIRPGKMVIIGDVSEDDVVDSINQLARSMKSKL